MNTLWTVPSRLMTPTGVGNGEAANAAGALPGKRRFWRRSSVPKRGVLSVFVSPGSGASPDTRSNAGPRSIWHLSVPSCRTDCPPSGEWPGGGICPSSPGDRRRTGQRQESRFSLGQHPAGQCQECPSRHLSCGSGETSSPLSGRILLRVQPTIPTGRPPPPLHVCRPSDTASTVPFGKAG